MFARIFASSCTLPTVTVVPSIVVVIVVVVVVVVEVVVRVHHNKTKWWCGEVFGIDLQ